MSTHCLQITAVYFDKIVTQFTTESYNYAKQYQYLYDSVQEAVSAMSYPLFAVVDTLQTVCLAVLIFVLVA